MGLVYKRSTKRDATKYARTPGMVPNPGVAALSVINPGTPPRKRRTRRTSRKPSGKRRTSRRATKNPYQWVEGVTDKRGRRRRKLPKRTTGSYKSQSRAESSGKRRATERSRLYVVDDLGNIMCPVDPVNRETKMKRNRGVRRNDAATNEAIMAAAGMGARTPVKRRRQTSKAKTSKAKAKKTSKAKTSKKKSATRRRARPKLGRRRVFLTGIPEIDRQLKAGKMPVMVQIPKKGKFGRPRTTAFVSPHYTRSMRGLHKKVSKKRPRYRRRKPVDVSFWSGEEDFESMTKKAMLAYAAGEGVFIDPKLRHGELVDVMEATFGTTAAAGRIPGGWVAANRGRKRRTSRKRTSKRRTSRRRTSARRKARRTTKRRASKRRTSKRRTSKRRTTRRRTTRRNPRRRTSRRASRRRSSRGRTSRRRTSRGRYGVRMVNNPRAVMPRRKRRGAKRAGRSLYRYTALGPKASKRRKSRSVPLLLAPQIVEYAELHRIDPLASYRRKKKKTSRTSVAANRRRGRRRRTSMRKNARRRTTRRNRTTANKRRRTSRRRTSKRRTSKRRTKRRRTRRNPGMGMAALRPRALWADVGRPVIAGGLGFLGARALGSGVQGIAPLQETLGDPWSRALGNSVGILATLVASAKVKMVRQNRGPLIVGMGIALLDNVISALGGDGGPLSFLSGGNVYSAGLLGSYVDIANAGSPYNGMMGEYVEYSPVSGMGAYVTAGQDAMMGEYVEQGVSGMGTYAEGIDPSDAATIEGMIDMAESQAAAGLYEAAAGVGNVYEAAAGVGVYEALAGGNPRWRGPTFGSRMTAYNRSQVPQVSTLQPPMPARPITRDLPVEIPITESLATPEGRGHAGGIFGANLFASMAAC